MNYLKELLFPRRCPICDDVMTSLTNIICEKCASKIKFIQGAYCCVCGKPLQNNATEYCHDCQTKEHFYTRGRAAFAYQDVADAIYRYKYAGRQEYAEYFGKAISTALIHENSFKTADALIPVPLHKKRKNKRGYNQSALLAQALAKEWKIPVREDLVVRCKNTKPMKLLNPSQRQNNLKKAFKLRQNDVKLNTIIIVDDIYTTGSTIDAIAALFLKQGVQNIYFVTLAIGKGC